MGQMRYLSLNLISIFSKPLDPIMRGAQFRRKIKRAVSELDSSKFHTGVSGNQRKDESSNISPDTSSTPELPLNIE